MAVDDNPANLKLITALLSERVETVVSCTSGQAAVQKAQEQHFDMVFMDIQMPQMDGVTACKLIKETQQNAATPVVAVTAHAMSGERDRLLSEGMDDYLTKPIDETMLLQVLNKWVPVRPAESEACLDFVAPTDTNSAAEAPPIVVEKPTSQVIDWNAALKQAANKEDLAIDMLQMLVDFIPEVAELADNILDNGFDDVEQVIHLIHKLHGSCSYCGVPRLKSICATIEKAFVRVTVSKTLSLNYLNCKMRWRKC
ncbi:BarA sensory histidine kinase [Vibrio maritimus]|uniref:BarA sensory histidine kinase n=1 Tax=Vibrio maritimus TaxID=990268 RepID=A0A090SXS7_9VIBR|nr:BarA sensory histidine kinase [Vibrio maritimus]